MIKFKEIINETNGKRIKHYFNLTQLVEITGLSIRSLKYRMLTVKEKYKDVPNLLHKEGREWRLHYTIVSEFLPKYKTNKATIYNHNWESITTWNTKNSYDIKYHKAIIDEVVSELPNNKIAYTIEKDKRGINHVHLISDVPVEILNTTIKTTLSKYLTLKRECWIQTNTINNKFSVIEYIKKASITN